MAASPLSEAAGFHLPAIAGHGGDMESEPPRQGARLAFYADRLEPACTAERNCISAMTAS